MSYIHVLCKSSGLAESVVMLCQHEGIKNWMSGQKAHCMQRKRQHRRAAQSESSVKTQVSSRHGDLV